MSELTFDKILDALKSDYDPNSFNMVDSILWIPIKGTDVHPDIREGSSHKSQIDLTYGATLPEGESPVDDFFPYLKKPEHFKASRQLQLNCAYLEANLKALGTDDFINISDNFVVTGMTPRNRANPSLQLQQLPIIRKLLPENSHLIFVHSKNEKSYLAIGINSRCDADSALRKLVDESSRISKKLFLAPNVSNQTQVFDSAEIVDVADPSAHLEELIPIFSKHLKDYANIENNKTKNHRYIAALLSKPFLILTGLSGSGKTKLAQAFAQWITPEPGEDGKNPHVALIPVGADWMGNENILGYPNGLDDEKYISTKALELILHAKKEANKDIPHFLILDEMNLSHVERYFADMLSAIESEEEIPLYQGALRKTDTKDVPASLKLPKNIFIIGTVNVDETTYMFSPKVLDRANVIEFRMKEKELTAFMDTPKKPNLNALAGEGTQYAKGFVTATNDHEVSIPTGVKVTYITEMEKFFKALVTEGAEFGYRTAYEAARFMHFYKVLGNHAENTKEDPWFDKAFDAVIVQKFLPKLHGSSTKLSSVLKELWILCHEPAAAKEETTEGDDGPDKKDATTANSDEEVGAVRYAMSEAKITKMRRVLDRNGFVSFAEA